VGIYFKFDENSPSRCNTYSGVFLVVCFVLKVLGWGGYCWL